MLDYCQQRQTEEAAAATETQSGPEKPTQRIIKLHFTIFYDKFEVWAYDFLMKIFCFSQMNARSMQTSGW